MGIKDEGIVLKIGRILWACLLFPLELLFANNGLFLQVVIWAFIFRYLAGISQNQQDSWESLFTWFVVSFFAVAFGWASGKKD